MPDPNNVIVEENLTDLDNDSEETEDTLTDDGEEQDDNELESDEEVSDDDDETDGEDGDEDEDLEAKYLAEHKLPGDPKSVDDVIASYKEAVRKLNEYERNVNKREDDTGLDDYRQDKTEQRQSFFKTGLMANTVSEMLKSGGMDENTAQSWKSVAKIVDESFNPLIGQIESVLNALATQNREVTNELKESSWARFKYKDLAPREQLDAILKKTGDFNYSRAFQRLLVSDESLVAKFAEKQQKRGSDKGGKRSKLPRFTSNRRSKPIDKKSGLNLKKYLNPDKTLNETVLNGLPTDFRLKVIEKYEKEFLSQ